MSSSFSLFPSLPPSFQVRIDMSEYGEQHSGKKIEKEKLQELFQ